MGSNCTDCETLKGCKNGKCTNQPNTCECDKGWKGHFCDEPSCEQFKKILQRIDPQTLDYKITITVRVDSSKKLHTYEV